MSATPDRHFCGHCGERLPPFGADLGYCAGCASKYRSVIQPAASRSSEILRESRAMYSRMSAARAKSIRDPWLAAALALVFPGAGQIYNGHWIKALLVLVTSPLVIPWLIGIVDAFFSANRTNEQIADRSDYVPA
jgi:TM2 domain-containing membrane protein YozV